VGAKVDQDVQLAVQRGQQELRVMVRPKADERYRVGEIGALPDVYPSVRSVTPGDPADRAGLKAGDELVRIGGTRMVFARQVSAAIGPRGGQPTEIVVRRDGQEQIVTVTPEQRGANAIIGIGIANATTSFTPTPLEAIGLSVKRNFEFSGLILETVWGLLAGQTSPKQLMGPVGIAQLSGESAEAGWIALFSLMASISLNLGLLNLLPIPILDGGHITIMAMEAIARRDFSLALKEKMLFAGFVLLMMLMVTVIYNDLTRIAWIERLMPWRN
jgi:regulator of sigma E protease